MRWMCFVTAPFFEPVAFSASFSSGAIAALICSAADGDDCSSSRGASRRSSRIAELRTSSRIFFESSVVILRDELDEEPADERARVLERRQRLLLGPVSRAAAPEVVVLVEVPLLALREVVAAAGEAVLERGERLVAVDVDAARPRPCTWSSSPFRSAARFSLSTAVTIDAAK